MTTVALLCSGQGYQGAGMFDLVADAPQAQPVFVAATAALNGQDPRDLVAGADDTALHANVMAQVLCCTQALAAWATLEPELDAQLVVAGYSVGELAAWGVAGALDVGAVLELVVTRAELMDAQTRQRAGLAAVRGLSDAELSRICHSTGVYVAIRNGPGQVVLGGLRSALDEALRAATQAGAQKVTPLPVTVPSHTRLLQQASDQFDAVLRQRQDVRPPNARLISGIDGATVFDEQDGLGKLARQISHTVQWGSCMASCRSSGATRSLELGPGTALATLMAAEVGEQNSRSLQDFRSVDGAAHWLTT